MATLWFQWLARDYYVNMKSLEHAYYVGSMLFESPATYMTTLFNLNTNSMSRIGADPRLHVYVYYGHHTPPVKEEWFPNGLRLITISELMENRECKLRLFKVRMHRKQEKINNPIRKTKSYTCFPLE